MFLFIAGLLLSSFHSRAQERPEFTAAIVSTLPSPLIIKKENAPEGVVVDYLNALADELHIKFKINLLPRLRIDNYKNEKHDINCYSSYAWNDNAKAFLWSRPIFYKRELIVGTVPLPSSINNFENATIGTIHGYKYPALEKAFAEKKLLRDDAEDEESNINKLIYGRIKYASTDEMFYQYFKKKHPEHFAKLSKEYLVVNELPIQCALSTHSKLSLEKLNHAIDAIITSGKLKRIFSKYK